MTEQELLLDCVRRLNAGKVSYMLTGSMASNAWGVPRTTHDLDFVIQLPRLKSQHSLAPSRILITSLMRLPCALLTSRLTSSK